MGLHQELSQLLHGSSEVREIRSTPAPLQNDILTSRPRYGYARRVRWQQVIESKNGNAGLSGMRYTIKGQAEAGKVLL